MKKLNEAQLLLLMVLDHQQSLYTFPNKPYPISTASLNALLRRNLAERIDSHGWRITEAGSIEASKYVALDVPWTEGRSITAVCDWIEKVGWKPELNGGL